MQFIFFQLVAEVGLILNCEIGNSYIQIVNSLGMTELGTILTNIPVDVLWKH